MGQQALLNAIREAGGDRVWNAGVSLTRSGVIRGRHADGDELCFEVKPPGKARPHEVFLWPGEEDWGCDCELPGDCCVHVAAAAIYWRSAKVAPDSFARREESHKVRVKYAFTTQKAALSVKRFVVFADGREQALEGSLSKGRFIPDRQDLQVESLLVMQPAGPLNADALRRMLVLMDPSAPVTLDGKPVKVSAEPVLFRVRVSDQDASFRVSLVRPPNIESLYRGAVVRKKTLRPTSHGELTADQRRMLVRGVLFGPDEVGRLVSEYLPRLREKVPVDIATTRLPGEDALTPRVALGLTEKPGGLEVHAELVYGDPPVARITPGGTLKRVTEDVVPARDLAAERQAQRAFEALAGLSVGYRHLLAPDAAIEFLSHRLPKHDGPVKGKVDPARYRVLNRDLVPQIAVRQLEAEGGDPGWALDVRFEIDGHEADADMVMMAWQTRRTLVPLLDGGYAPLPQDWFARHGALLRELMEARDGNGQVGRNATAALVELLEDTSDQVPPDLRKLRTFLEGDDGLPEVPIPQGFNAELRPYQLVGFRWLRFLRDMELNGVLADDMGLGKTVQTLAAIADAGGPALVVAPTSVLRNWQNEASRFAPNLKVNLYHGPKRELDPDADLTLTSYALLRLDIARLRETEWTYAVLDEAQAIKNPNSQTAKSARALRAKHRLALTGTPVENRLEELWSLFQYLMPGLLGSLQAFRDRFSRPIENGSQKARSALRARVRPYIMRRLKQQVATELPALTEMVIRCEMSPEQRKVYQAVRLAARQDVQEALAAKGKGASTIKVLEALLRMRQACCDPALLPGNIGDGAPSAKLDEFENLLVELVCDDHKALVFSQWTSLLDQCETRLRKLGIAWVRLDGTTRDRQAVIDAFQSDGGPPVFLLSLKAGGTGLNLTAADYVLHLDPWWNPAVQQQATDRAHRIGQDKPVVSVKLIAEGTVEERILELQDTKRDLADAALGTEGGFLKALSADELRSLFESA